MSDEDDIFGGPPIDLSWQDIGRINQDGYVDTDPVGDDPRIFDDQFEMRSREKERSPKNVQATTIIPQRSGPWSGNNQLGIEQGFAPDANNQQTILKLDEWGFPEVWTVTLGLEFQQPALIPQAVNFEVTAILQFGTGGAVQEVEVDWKNGTTITLPFNALNVIAKYNAPIFARGGGTIPPSLRLRVTLAKGALQNSEPTRSYSFQSDEDLIVSLPKFAKSLFLCPTDLNALSPFAFYTQDWIVRFVSNDASPIGASATYRISQCVSWIDFTNQLVGGPMWLPVPPYARAVRILTSAGVQVNEEATFIFKLAF